MSERPAAKVSNPNAIPSAAIWAFGLAMLAGLLALPFLVFKVMASTQNQAQGMTLADLAGLPRPTATLRCTVRETRDKGLLAARYELAPDHLARIREALTPGRPDDAFFAAVKTLSPAEKNWLPDPASPGPWRGAHGRARGHAWTAALDESANILWIHAVRDDTAGK